MKSKWFNLKEKAISLRKKGLSIKYVEKKLGINRSTLSGWFKNIELTKKQQLKLHEDWKNGLKNAQKLGGLWHKEQANNRRKIIREEVEKFVSKINIDQ